MLYAHCTFVVLSGRIHTDIRGNTKSNKMRKKKKINAKTKLIRDDLSFNVEPFEPNPTIHTILIKS